jgi:site-specific recombinase XerD
MHNAARDSDVPLTSLLDSWGTSLEAEHKSSKTIASYISSVRLLAAYLDASGLPSGTESTGANEVRQFLAGQLARVKPNGQPYSPATAQLHWRNLRVWFGWLVAEGERQAASPMLSIARPKAPVRVRPFFTDDDLTALLRACSGDTLEARRDTALIRILIDTGVRVSGLANLRYSQDETASDVFLKAKRLRVRLKGGAETWIPMGPKTAKAVDRYIRTRNRSTFSGSPWLWLGTRGRGVEHMTDSGIRAMLNRRGQQAGVQNVYPHRFRHTFADQWLSNGGNVDDLMNVAGWSTYDMPLRYARGRGIERAQKAHQQFSPGERI